MLVGHSPKFHVYTRSIIKATIVVYGIDYFLILSLCSSPFLFGDYIHYWECNVNVLYGTSDHVGDSSLTLDNFVKVSFLYILLHLVLKAHALLYYMNVILKELEIPWLAWVQIPYWIHWLWLPYRSSSFVFSYNSMYMVVIGSQLLPSTLSFLGVVLIFDLASL